MTITGLITMVLELLGAFLLVAALFVLVAPHSLPGALALAGAGLLAISWAITRVGQARKVVVER